MPDTPTELKNRSRLWSVFLRWKNSIKTTRILQSKQDHIERTPSGLAVFNNGDHCWELKWNAITRIVAFKRDLYSLDIICFGFQKLDDPNTLWCIHEDMTGFNEIIGDIERLTKGAWPDRFHDVAIPAFETCWTEIWKTKDAADLMPNPLLVWIKLSECPTD